MGDWIDPSELSEEELRDYLRQAQEEVESAYPGLEKLSDQCYALIGQQLYDGVLKWERQEALREIMSSEMSDPKYRDVFEQHEDYLTGAKVPNATQGTAAYLRIVTVIWNIFCKLQGYDPVSGEKLDDS